MKKILWVSRHQMQPVQLGALRRLFGVDVQVTHEPRPFDSAETIVRRAQEGHFDDIIVVAPYSVLNRMVELGLRPLWADAEEVSDPAKADWSVKNRHYRFLGYKRVKRLVLELEDLGPEALRQPKD